jgi:hypothetical protein
LAVGVSFLGQASFVLAVVLGWVLALEPSLEASIVGSVARVFILPKPEQQEGGNVPKVIDRDLELAIEPSRDVVGRSSVEVVVLATDLDVDSAIG